MNADFAIAVIMFGSLAGAYWAGANQKKYHKASMIIFMAWLVIWIGPFVLSISYGAIIKPRAGAAYLGLALLIWGGAWIGSRSAHASRTTTGYAGAWYGALIALMLGSGPLAILVFH
jgi:hypothetical protein